MHGCVSYGGKNFGQTKVQKMSKLEARYISINPRILKANQLVHHQPSWPTDHLMAPPYSPNRIHNLKTVNIHF